MPNIEMTINTPTGIVFPPNLVIVKRNPNRGDALRNFPDEIPVKDNAWTVATLGHGIPITQAMWKFLFHPAINNKAGRAYVATSEAMWINLGGTPRPIDTVNEKVSAESITCGGALACWDMRVNNRLRLLSWNYMDVIDPLIHNPEKEPWRFWTPTSVDKGGNIYLVGAGTIANIPYLNYTGEIWIGVDEVIPVVGQLKKWDITDVMTKR